MLSSIHTSFHDRVLAEIKQAGLEFPGLDDQAILDRVIPTAEDWVTMQIVTNHLPTQEQVLFRDAYMSAPDVFDSVEFLADALPDFDELVEVYFTKWLAEFADSLSK